MKLISRYESKFGTFGDLYDKYGKWVCYTLERNYKSNIPNLSSVPEGVYNLEEHNSERHGRCISLVNHNLGVYHYENSKAVRYAILFHKANVMKELQGCIAPGLDIGTPFMDGKWGVVDSTNAMKLIMDLFDSGDNKLIIERR